MRISERSGRIGSRGNYCVPLVGAASVFVVASARSQSIGINELRALDPTLNGSGIRVAQPEASSGPQVSPPDFEVNPANSLVNQPPSLFTYTSSNGTSTSFGGSVGQESGHADNVASLFYGIPNGVATNVSHVDNYDADYFISLVTNRVNVPALVINQSFVVADNMGNPIQDPATDQFYDNYIAAFNKVIVSGAGNFGKPDSPSTAYNDISVGAFGTGASSSVGPTLDGRSKPDIVAPAGATSFSTPQVSGAAAILLQAGARGDGGAGAAADSQDFRTVKALLLNGATKPAGWTHTQTAPLDPNYGAGILNVFNSYEQLAGGKHAPITTTATLTLGGPHAPPVVGGNEPSTVGWDFTTLTMSAANDNVDHYFFNVTNPSALTATLDWERQDGQATINNLDLYLYDANTGALIDQSISAVDNVEYLFDQNLPAGRYDLQVLSHGGTIVSPTETYALAYNFAATPEPASGLMIVCGLGWVMGRRRRG